MAEIRLVCPRCAAEYRVPDSAVPSAGREVECSACGHVWHATTRLELADFQAAPHQPPADLPRPNRRLPDSVLDILKGEVEHERRARAVEEGQSPATAPDAPAPQAEPAVASDPEWPATTITRHFDQKPAAPALPAPPPVSQAPAPRHPVPLKSEAVMADAPPRPDPRPAQSVPAMTPPPQRVSAKSGYGLGFALAVLVAAGVLAFYLLTPAMAERGVMGETLASLRLHLDGTRLWLQDSLSRLAR